MELHARLIHTEAGLRVVEVRASRGDDSLGSALAEAGTAQEAEDLAIARLLQRLRDADRGEETHPLPSAPPARQPAPAPIRASTAGPGQGTAAAPRAPMVSPAVTRPATASPESSGSHAPSGAQEQSAGDGSVPIAGGNAPHQGPGPASLARGSHRSVPGATEEVPAQDRSAGQRRPAVAAPPDPWTEERLTAPPGAPEPADDPSAGPQSDPHEEPPADPEDWSQELTAVDLQLRRLGWSREQEGTYLQRAFGHPSRSRLTRYNDLRAYLMALEALERGSDPAVAAVPLRRSELLAQGDALLAQLGWSAEQGRAFLERELNRVSRQQLSDVQLLQFNMLLEGELLVGGAPLAPAAVDGAQR